MRHRCAPVYRHVCQACHMPDGRGASGAATIPALANDPRLKGAAYPVTVILHGKGAMPWFGRSLKPAEVAAVAQYIRTHFGNDYSAPVTEKDVIDLSAELPGEAE